MLNLVYRYAIALAVFLFVVVSDPALTDDKTGPSDNEARFVIVIAVDRDGIVAMPYSAEGMYRGYVREDGKTDVRIYEY